MSNLLQDIGFYTLTDERAAQACQTSPLWRCELLITDACNFKCPYCRGMKDEFSGTLKTKQALDTLQAWIDQGLKNVRLSGGEPTLHKGLVDMVRLCKEGGVERIALSTNGSASTELYDKLVEAGVNDFSISLDACCASDGDEMAGVGGKWETVVQNIRHLSAKTYVTVGVVLTDKNASSVGDIIEFADSLGVADIRIISAAQVNSMPEVRVSEDVLLRHPILRYRLRNLSRGRGVRGITETDNDRCPLVLDDMAAVSGKHFPCIIYLREQGAPIGDVGPTMRKERAEWAANHNTHEDPICRKNCLDVCVDYNNRHRSLSCHS